jgi:hypothetical protein
MFLEILYHMIPAAISYHFAFTTDSPNTCGQRRLYVATFRTTLRHDVFTHSNIVVDAHATVDPVAELARLNTSSAMLAAAFDRKYCCALHPAARKADHLAVVVATGIGTARREIIENVLSRNE